MNTHRGVESRSEASGTLTRLNMIFYRGVESSFGGLSASLRVFSIAGWSNW